MVARESWYWAELLIVLQPRVRTLNSLTNFVFDICCSEIRDIVCRVTLLLWQIWDARNDVIWNNIICMAAMARDSKTALTNGCATQAE